MPTTFTVFQLGVLADIDTVGGNNNNLAENAGALVGQTFGGLGNPLFQSAATFSPGTGGFTSGSATVYDQDNNPNENFRINGGANQVFDAASIYNATITYTDGTTANITAVIFQDTTGRTYLAPEFSANADQSALEAKAIRSLTLDSLSGNSFSGLEGNRQVWSTVVTCFTPGTPILTPGGERMIETLVVGDLVVTRDHGAQPIRWIGRTRTRATGKLAPVRISAGALGEGLPARDIRVSRQHRMMLRSRVAERIFGDEEILVPAISLVGQPGIEVATDAAEVEYLHILLDRHEIVFAAGAPSETLYAGPHAREAMGQEAVEEIETLFPGILDKSAVPARPLHRGPKVRKMLERHKANEKALVSLR